MIPHDVITRYKAGYPIDTITRELRVGNRRVRQCLRAAGVLVPRNGRAEELSVARGVHRVIRELNHAIASDTVIEVATKAGLSEAFWWRARTGRVSPKIDDLEAVANTLGYEIVLRRRAR